MSNKNGGPAFPGETITHAVPLDFNERYPGAVDELRQFNSSRSGMSLRDWFAGMALSGIIHDQIVSTNIEYDTKQLASGVSEAVYQIADSMLAERERTE